MTERRRCSRRVQTTTSPCMRAIERFSCSRQKPTCALDSQNATTCLRQSERHVPAAPIRTRELSASLSGQRRILTHVGASRLHTHALTQHHAQGCTISNTTFHRHHLLTDQHAFLSLGSTMSHFIGSDVAETNSGWGLLMRSQLSTPSQLRDSLMWI